MCVQYKYLEFFAFFDTDLQTGVFAQLGPAEQGHLLVVAEHLGGAIGQAIGTRRSICDGQNREFSSGPI